MARFISACFFIPRELYSLKTISNSMRLSKGNFFAIFKTCNLSGRASRHITGLKNCKKIPIEISVLYCRNLELEA